MFDMERQKGRSDDYRSRFQRDRDRIVHSSSFRRLQGKTQVFFPGEYDFYRTRLTHSLEVAQIGTSICTYLLHANKKSSLLPPLSVLDRDLVEGICLAHDIGHPPFGHAGERALNICMADYGGFEGNAQTLKIINQLISTDKGIRSGMNPTRAFMDGVMKYKAIFNFNNRPNKHFLYLEQKDERNFIFGGEPLPDELSDTNSLNEFRSIECQIMDWADDIAYAVGDLTDGIKSNFITTSRLSRWEEERLLNSKSLEKDKSNIDDLLIAMREDRVRKWASSKIRDFIKSVSIVERESSFMNSKTNRYAFKISCNIDSINEISLYREISRDLIFKTPNIQQLDHKGELIIRRLFNELGAVYIDSNNPKEGLLSREIEKAIIMCERKEDKARKICDYIASMTDGFAVRMYKRFFEPNFGSITDLIF